MKARFEFKHDEEYNEYIRTYFAAMAMQGLLSNGEHNNPDINRIDERASIAAYSIQLSDALIKALNK